MAAKTLKGITVEINGKTTGLANALKDVTKTSTALSSNLKEINKALKLDPGNTELLNEKQKILSESVAAARKELETLEGVQKQVSDQYANGDIDRGAWLEYQNKLQKAKQHLEDLEKAQKDFGTAAAQAIKEAGAKIEEYGGKVEGVGKKLMPVSGVAAAAGTALTKMAWDFEDGMAKVSTIADTTEVPISDLEKQIKELSDSTGVEAGEIAENVYNAISAGQKTGDAVNFVSKATDLARAGFAETGDALDVLSTIMNAYGLEASEVDKVSNDLIMTQNLGKTTVAELSSSMGKVIPTAKSTGVNLDKLCGAYAVMTSNGVATAETTTYLNSMLNELGKQGSTAANAFAAGTEHIKEGGLTMAEAMEQGWSLSDVLSVLDEQAAASGTSINNMFSSAEAGKAANILWDNAEKFNGAVEEIQGSTTATSDALGNLETSGHKTEVAINQIKNAGLEFGQTISAMLAPRPSKAGRIYPKREGKAGRNGRRPKASHCYHWPDCGCNRSGTCDYRQGNYSRGNHCNRRGQPCGLCGRHGCATYYRHRNACAVGPVGAYYRHPNACAVGPVGAYAGKSHIYCYCSHCGHCGRVCAAVEQVRRLPQFLD